MENSTYQQALDHFLDKRPDLIHVQPDCIFPGDAPLWTATSHDLHTIRDVLETHYTIAKGTKFLVLSREE